MTVRGRDVAKAWARRERVLRRFMKPEPPPMPVRDMRGHRWRPGEAMEALLGPPPMPLFNVRIVG